MIIICRNCGGSFLIRSGTAKNCQKCRPAVERARQRQYTIERAEHKKMFQIVDGHRQVNKTIEKDGRVYGRSYSDFFPNGKIPKSSF